MAHFFSPEELALMAQDETYGQFFPASSGHSQPSIMYSPPPLPATEQPNFTDAQSGSIYAPPQGYMPMGSPSYPLQSYWASEPLQSPSSLPEQPMPQQHIPQQHMAHQPMQYPTYPPLAAMNTTHTSTSTTSLLPDYIAGNRPSRSHSAASSYGMELPSNVDVPPNEYTRPASSRSLSPSASDLGACGIRNQNGTWRCAYPGCSSRAVFTRGCDLRKHYKRHTKSFFCRHEGCPQSTGGGFSSKKDLSRHEARHNPGVLCEWEGCERVFSRVDNMRDHVKRIHLKTSRHGSPRPYTG